jgi:hypothetical protein
MCLQSGFVIFWRKDFGAKAAHKMLVKLTPGVSVKKTFISSSLMLRQNKLECLSLPRCFFLASKTVMLPQNKLERLSVESFLINLM